eukprot:3544257-Prymnesium_polylepis.1
MSEASACCRRAALQWICVAGARRALKVRLPSQAHWPSPTGRRVAPTYEAERLSGGLLYVSKDL